MFTAKHLPGATETSLDLVTNEEHAVLFAEVVHFAEISIVRNYNSVARAFVKVPLQAQDA